ncbi:hypothetical protein K458DRAFT_420562 [Lentithecium fluviatile CBS 122367]|uniref:Uncharacterized protein n=1 Tax=Lentithecium fluviatile CBS 122367 TaxID=1168545 RepID=A0A6G1IUZ3_9PLEO|nr:hypothetical protein K458DRAFT_420562 [Lentithecium fluviatile CBS 122367]
MEYFQEDDFLETNHTTESQMNIAGRTSAHPFRDLRSASYAHRKTRKYANDRRRNSGTCHSVGCRKWCQSEQRLKNKRQKRDRLVHELWASQQRVPCYTLCFQPAKQMYVQWDVRLKEEFDEYIEDMNDDVVRYEKLHKNAAIFESSETWVEVGEEFSTWARRRIAEMRTVKEKRLRAAEPVAQQVKVWKTHRTGPAYGDTYKVYCGTPGTTTLPTTTYDAYGHALLRAALTPLKWVLSRARFNSSISLFPRIYNSTWFGEFAWKWHRNASGCWEIGYWDGPAEGNGRGCGGCAIPCPCCCASNGSMYYGCYCEEFGDEPAPEETQRCSLVEWVGPEGRRLIVLDDLKRESNEVTAECGSVAASVFGSEWSVVDEDLGSVSCCSSIESTLGDFAFVET